jgi:hypothetical protein
MKNKNYGNHGDSAVNTTLPYLLGGELKRAKKRAKTKQNINFKYSGKPREKEQRKGKRKKEVGIILGIKEKFKNFFHQSRKMVQTPKELPEVGVGLGAGLGVGAEKEAPMPKISPPLPPPRTQEKTEASFAYKPASPQPTLVTPQPKPIKELSLPKIEPLMLREKSSLPTKQMPVVYEDELKKFEEAINKINIDIIHTEAPPATTLTQAAKEEAESEGYYKPSLIGEGYFSEIEHYIKNKDVNEIIDDVLKKDFLTSMKDYHDTKAQGKPYYLHKQDLKNRLQNKMEALRRLEEEWHSLRTRIEEEEKRKREVEKRIDTESQELKDIFKQVRMTQWLEQEAPKEQIFKLKSGGELKSLNELRKALSYMTDEEFSHHVNQERNDFATWARETLQNPELADKISKAKTKADLQAILQNPF